MKIQLIFTTLSLILIDQHSNGQFIPQIPQPNLFSSESLLNPLQNLLEQTISKSLGQFDKPIGQLVPNLPTLDPLRIADCYVSEVQGQAVNIFDPLKSFKAIVGVYYKAFPDKNVTTASITNLFDSTREIIFLCLDPKRSSNSSIKYGFTALSDMSQEEFARMRGAFSSSPLSNSSTNGSKVLVRNKRLTGSDLQCQPRLRSVPFAFDWRSRGAVTPVRDQKSCGSCWAFGSIGALEGALLAQRRTHTQSFWLDLSEQQLINCVRPHKGCDGGTFEWAMQHIMRHGIVQEHQMPYVSKSDGCGGIQRAYSIRNYCNHKNPSDRQIMERLVKFGPAYMIFNSEPLSRNYRGGVFSEANCAANPLNHGVVLIGYTWDAWIFKNSWGTSWGEAGFFKLARGRNMCGINAEMGWALV